jgi:hypothetical protein
VLSQTKKLPLLEVGLTPTFRQQGLAHDMPRNIG